jgi:hypothetical protein
MIASHSLRVVNVFITASHPGLIWRRGDQRGSKVLEVMKKKKQVAVTKEPSSLKSNDADIAEFHA